MKDYDKNKELSYLQYWDLNNVYSWAMSQKQFNEDFIKNYNEESDEGCFLEVDVRYIEELHELYNDLLFLTEKNED